MWCVEEIIKDLESGVRNLRQTFSNLELDALHESIYGVGKYFPPDYCNKLAEEYKKLVTLCDEYLQGHCTIGDFVDGIISSGRKYLLYKIKPFLDSHLANKIPELEEESEEEMT